MSVKTLPVSKQVKAKSYSKSPPHKTDADKIRALEEQLDQREAEIARLSADNQRLLKETEQRATELQIINNIGQTLTDGLDLNNTIERVGERLRETLKFENFGIVAYDAQTELAISLYLIRNGKRVDPKHFLPDKYRLAMRLASRREGKPWVVNTNAEKYWIKFGTVLDEEIAKSFVMFPLLAGSGLVGSITIADYEKENAFTDLPISLLETIASNMGTAIQNVRLFDETQRLLKETEQRATELQIINNIGQTLTEGFDLQSALERVGERLRDALKIDSIGIAAFDPKSDRVIAQYLYHYGERLVPNQITTDRSKFAIRFAARYGRSWVVNTDAEKHFRKFATVGLPKSFVALPLLAGKEVIGGIILADYVKENAFTDFPIDMLETISSNLGTAIQNARLFDETQHLLIVTEQRATELQIINNIGQMLTEGLDLQSTLERVGERLREVLKVESIGIIANDTRTGLAVSHFVYLKGKRIIPDRFSLGKNLFGMRFAARVGGKPLVVNSNVEKNWRKFVADVPEYAEIPKSFVLVPLLAGRELVGSITIADYEDKNAFVDLPLNLLETIASNMGTAIQNVRLFEETQRLLKETEQHANELAIINSVQARLVVQMDLQAIYNLVGEKIRNLFDAQTVDIAIYDSVENLLHFRYTIERGEYFPIEPRPLMGFRKHVIESRQYLLINDLTREERDKYGQPAPIAGEAAQSVLFVPMAVGEEVKGVISLQNLDRTNAFSDADIRLLQTFANSMTVALENARLFDETQRLLKETEQRATELQIINNIGQTLTEGGDLESMIQRVGERIQEALNINNVAISIFDKENERVIAPYMVRNGKQIKLTQENYALRRYKMLIRAWARAGGGSSFWVVNKDIDKIWRKSWLGPVADDVPKSLVALPLLAGGEIIGGISIADYDREDAFADISTGMLEIIAANMGTAIQNVRLFEETQRLFKDAEEARAAAERANKAKSTFLANMSHELRTPLNAIMGFTSIVRDKSLGVLPEKQINNLEKVLASSQHLLGLINTVLDLAKIEAGRMDVIPAKFNINALIDLCGNLSTPLLKPGVLLEKQVDDSVGIVYSDQDKIKQILLNLLSNAAKFTHAGHILLSAEKPGSNTVNISVTDSGIGIKADAIDRVFEEFQQADTTTTRQYGGTGLGLPISRNLARLLGGDLTATSELGKGSTFTLTIPIQFGRKSSSLPDLKPASVQPAESHSQAGSSQP